MKSFALTRLLLPSNSKIELREKEPHFTDGKTETKKIEEKGNKGKLEASGSVTVLGWRAGMIVTHRVTLQSPMCLFRDAQAKVNLAPTGNIRGRNKGEKT